MKPENPAPENTGKEASEPRGGAAGAKPEAKKPGATPDSAPDARPDERDGARPAAGAKPAAPRASASPETAPDARPEERAGARPELFSRPGGMTRPQNPSAGGAGAAGGAAQGPAPAAGAPAAPGGRATFARPVAQKKAPYARAWILFFGLAFIIFAVWTPVRSYIAKRMITRHFDESSRKAASFVSIAYYGVSGEDGSKAGSADTSPARFADHISELNKRGYVPIRIQDVVDFYEKDIPLPEKSVLVTFEQARRTSYADTREVLRAQRFYAVMGVWGKPVDAGELQSLLWPHLRSMLMVGFWEIAAESYNGFSTISTGPDNETSTFFSAPMWMRDEVRYETPDEFRRRIAMDHTNIITRIKSATGKAPDAYFYPYGAYGQYDEAASIIRKINLELVRNHYKLGFTLGSLPLNTKETDPACLNRLLVNPNWTGAELADRLDMVWPEKETSGSNVEKDYPAYAWMGDWGIVDNSGDDAILKAIKPASPLVMNTSDDTVSTAGAKAWLSGSGAFYNGYVFLRTYLKRGSLEIYLRQSSTTGHLTFGITPEGEAFVRETSPTGGEFMLARDVVREDETQEYAILAGLKGNLLYVRVNGKLLFGGAVALGSEGGPGMIGAAVWDNIKGTAEARIFETKYMPLSPTVATWSPDKTGHFQEISTWLKDNSYRYTMISPPWLEIRAGGQLSEYLKWNEKSVKIMARLNQSPLLPKIVVVDSVDFRPPSMDIILRGLIAFGADGLYVDASDCSSASLPRLAQWISVLNAELAKAELAFAIRLPDDSLKMPSIGNLIRQHPDMTVVIPRSRNIIMQFEGKFADLTYAEVSEKESPLALYYKIASLLGEDADADIFEDVDSIRQKGIAAFASGEYEDAVQYWTEWREKTGRDADALALIGDAHVRMRNYPAAIACYSESLELNPGQIEVAIRYSRLLSTDARADVLDLYSTSFPETPAIVVEQARFLKDHGREDSARGLLRALIAENPEHIPARRLLHELLTDPKSRYDNMREIIRLSGATDTGMLAFGNMLWSTDMLTVSEAAVFIDLIRKTSAGSASRFVRRLFNGFMPKDEIVDENFKYGELSDRWVSFGLPSHVGSSGHYELRAGTDMAEAYLRLKNSEFMRDGYIEVDLDESVGFFWLYARRSDNAMVRFGFDEEGMLRVQTWENGHIRTSENKPWIRPSGSITMRLEVRGQGAHGYVNGAPAFPAGVAIPDSLAYGWWCVAPFSSELGMARIKIRRIAAGPLPTTVVALPRMSEGAADDFFREIRNASTAVSAIAPLMYVQDQRGGFSKMENRSERKIRMWSSFSRVCYMPIVDITYFADSDMTALTELIQSENLTAVALWLHSSPSEAWLAKLAAVSENTSAYICVMHVGNEVWTGDLSEADWPEDIDYAYVNVRQIERGNILFPPTTNLWQKVTVPRLSQGKSTIERLVPLNDKKELARMAAKDHIPELLQPRIFAYIPENDVRVYVKGIVPPDVSVSEDSRIFSVLDEEPEDAAADAATNTVPSVTNIILEVTSAAPAAPPPPRVDLLATVSNIVERVVANVMGERGGVFSSLPAAAVSATNAAPSAAALNMEGMAAKSAEMKELLDKAAAKGAEIKELLDKAEAATSAPPASASAPAKTEPSAAAGSSPNLVERIITAVAGTNAPPAAAAAPEADAKEPGKAISLGR